MHREPAARPASSGDHRIPEGSAAFRLVDYLKAKLVAVPVTEIGDLITEGFVTIEIGGTPVTGRTIDIVTGGDRIVVDEHALARLRRADRWNPPWPQALDIVHEDDDVLVVAKAAGMHVHPLGDRREHTLVNALVFHAGAREGHPWADWRPHAVQRLDCVVSGLLVVAKNAESKAALTLAHQRGDLSRTYVAMVGGVVTKDAGVESGAIGRDPVVRGRRAIVPVEHGGRPARTRWSVLERHADRTLVELAPETGRTHQLRVHLASIGHPILGDVLYGGAPIGATPESSGPRAIALHAREVRFRHPRGGGTLRFRRDPPAGFGFS